MSDPVLHAAGIERYYQDGETRLEVLRGVELTVEEAETAAIVGASGTGKSTLLHILGTLDRPSAGRVLLAGRYVDSLSERELARTRSRDVAFVFQLHHLLPEFTALENVALPLLARGDSSSSALGEARAMLERVGLGERLTHLPRKLSGGEQQRVAVARALVGRPRLVLLDEPTGNLDPATGTRLLELILELAREYRLSSVIVTHDAGIARRADRAHRLADGRLDPWSGDAM